jgi:uncharacterized protein (TIGR02118 family)
MMKFMVLFRPAPAQDVFENAYNDFLALIERMPGVQRRQVVHVVASPTGGRPYERILEIYFPDRAALEQSLLSPAGQEAGQELNRRFPRDSFVILISEVFEESGGATPTS